MACVPRLLTHVAAAIAALVLVLAFPAGARADSDAGWAYIPNTGPPSIPDTGPASMPDTGPVSMPDTGSASMPDTGPAYVPDVDPAYVPNARPAYVPGVDPAYGPEVRPAPIPNADSRYIYVSKQSPERLYLIGGGRVIFQSPVNTGIRAAPTPSGVFRIFASYLQKTMKGTDPRTFRRYNDRNVPYVMYFNGGLAIHGFRRSGYGYPQSFGCIELPVYKARELYGLLQGGSDTKVVVTQRRPAFERGRAASDEDRLGRYASGARG
jgi:lipoprotein-anchoring transpeptidase ErfK/SrfK